LSGYICYIVAMQQGSFLKSGDEEFEIVPDTARLYTEGLLRVYDRFGFSTDISTSEVLDSTAFWKFLEQVIAVWRDCYPDEAVQWVEDIENYRKFELPVQELIKESKGRSLMSWPPRLFQMLCVFFPNVKFHDKDFVRVFLSKHGAFSMTNYGA
jgi:hypothetical protein